MYKRCTTEQGTIQQCKFEESLLEFMQKQSLQDISVTELCQHAGLSRNTFYRYFGNKEDVLYSMIDRVLMNYAKFRLPEESISTEAPEEYQRLFAYWYRQKPLLDALSRNNLGSTLMKRVMVHVSREETKALYNFGANDAIAGTEILLFHISGIMDLIFIWHYNEFQKTSLQMAKLLDQLLTKPPIQLPKL